VPFSRYLSGGIYFHYALIRVDEFLRGQGREEVWNAGWLTTGMRTVSNQVGHAGRTWEVSYETKVYSVAKKSRAKKDRRDDQNLPDPLDHLKPSDLLTTRGEPESSVDFVVGKRR